MRHEINQVIFSDDVGQATADLANSVKAIANDKEAMQHFQIESISVVPIKGKFTGIPYFLTHYSQTYVDSYLNCTGWSDTSLAMLFKGVRLDLVFSKI